MNFETKWQVRLSGTGGQGVIKAAIILAQAAIYDGYNAIQTQVYGPESRGGSTKSEVIISENKILYPKIQIPNVLLAMSEKAYEKFGHELLPGGILVLDGDVDKGREQRDNITVYKAPITCLTRENFNSELSANVVSLGVIVRATQMVTVESLQKALAENFRGKVLEANLRAFELGMSVVAAE